MIPADKLTAIAESIVEKYWLSEQWTATGGRPGETAQFRRDGLVRFVEIILACGAAHEEHQRKHGR